MSFPSIGIFILPAVVYSCYQKCRKFLCTYIKTAPLSVCLKWDSFSMVELCCRCNENFSYACLSYFNCLDNVCLFTADVFVYVCVWELFLLWLSCWCYKYRYDMKVMTDSWSLRISMFSITLLWMYSKVPPQPIFALSLICDLGLLMHIYSLSHLQLAFLRFSSKFQTDEIIYMKNRLQQFTKFIYHKPCIFSM